jgi:hypothetical protein
VYFAARLDIPHYQVAAEDLPDHLASVASFNDTVDISQFVEVIHLRNTTDHLGSHVNVFNTLSDEMELIAERMPLEELAEAVLDSEQEDGSRGNKYIDVGYASDRNSKRGLDHGGVAKPAPLARSGESMFNEAMVGMTQMCDLSCQSEYKGKLFVCERRQALFSGRQAVGNRIEALRVAMTNADNLVEPHGDDKNDTSPNFQGVVTYSKWLFVQGQWWRLSLIGYSRKSIAGFFRRKDLYQPLVDRVKVYYEQMPGARKLVSASLLDFSSLPPSQRAKRIKPHANKCVFYSIYVHSLSKLQKKLSLSVWHVLALMTNTIISESPEYFVLATKHMLKQGKTLLSPIDLAYDFYNVVFLEKEKRRREKSAVPGQRHQPHYNVRKGKAVVARSIHNFCNLYRAFKLLDDKLALDPHYYGKAVSFLQDGYRGTGVCGAGGLTAQHLIHIGVLCGFFPTGMLAHAEIGEQTNSYSYLRRWEGMTDHLEDTRQLLACTSVTLGLPYFQCENIICKFGQDQVEEPPVPKVVRIPIYETATGSAAKKIKVGASTGMTRKAKRLLADKEKKWKKTAPSPYRDSIYRNQCLFDLDPRGNLIKYALDGSSIVPFIHSDCILIDCPQHPFEKSPITFAYWKQKIGDRRVVPMKEATRNHLKTLKLFGDDGGLSRPFAALKKRKRPTVLNARDKKRKTDEGQVSAMVAADSEGDDNYRDDVGDEDGDDVDDDDEYFPPDGVVKKNVKHLVVASPSPRLLQSQTKSPQVIVGCTATRISVPLNQLAMDSLALPWFQKQFINYEPHLHIRSSRKAQHMYRANVVVPLLGPMAPWHPPTDIDAGLITALFPESVVASDNKRYHQTKAQAARYLYIAAVLAAEDNAVYDAPAVRKKDPSKLDCIVLIDRNEKKGFAAINRQPGGGYAFSFLAPDETLVGPLLFVKS